MFRAGILLFVISACVSKQDTDSASETFKIKPVNESSLVVLGTVQDAGSPHIACTKACCRDLFSNPDPGRKVVSLGLVDMENHRTYLFEATPEISHQLKKLKEFSGDQASEVPDGIFLTHAHIGHYAGLMYLGKEALNANSTWVYAMPRMKTFLETNGPWSQLVTNGNISLQPLLNREPKILSSAIKIMPFTVPHRDEFSETVGYLIEGPRKRALFIPDIDKWEKWDASILEEIKRVDYAFIDATFYDGSEINNRDIREIPHPFMIESMVLFEKLTLAEKRKVYFIHLNHTNPALNEKSEQSNLIRSKGFNIARIYDTFPL